MYGDKLYRQGRPLFPTPESTPEELACRTFRIPANAAWLGLFMGAVSLLTDPENFQQFEGGMSREDAAAVAQSIIQQVYEHAEDGCTVCLLPTGEPVMRLHPDDGSIQQLTGEGWQTPTGDLAPPTIPARTGGTPQDQMCLAAANAMNVLKVLYETVSDDFNGGLTNAETLAEFLLAIALLIATAVAAWAAALIAIVIIVWDIFFDTLEFLAADLWDANFDEALKCVLYNCAENADGVVTFDYNCVINQLAQGTDVTGSLTADQIRLFGQIIYMLHFIGADGLNLAGATTAITSADCDDCGEWCYTFDFTESDGDWVAEGTELGGTGGLPIAVYHPGQGWGRNGSVSNGQVYIMHAGGQVGMTSVEVFLSVSVSSIFWIYDPVGNDPVLTTPVTGDHFTVELNPLDVYENFLAVGIAQNNFSGRIQRLTFRGVGNNPFGNNNCEG